MRSEETLSEKRGKLKNIDVNEAKIKNTFYALGSNTFGYQIHCSKIIKIR